MRTRAERRKLNYRKALRKRFITRNVYKLNEKDSVYSDGYFDNLNQYSKNKIHCSDYCCSTKTNNRGRNKFYGKGSKNWKVSDQRKVQNLIEQLELEKELSV